MEVTVMKGMAEVKRFFSPKGELGRMGFLVTLFFVWVLSGFFSMIASQLWLLENPFPSFTFNLNLSFSNLLGLAGIYSGILPLTIWVLIECTYMSFEYAGMYGYGFFIEMLVADVLFVFYILQCFKRCRDMNTSPWACLIPIYNPVAFLLSKGGDDGRR